MTQNSHLTAADVQQLLSDPSAAHRASTAAKLGNQMVAGSLEPAERALAEEIIRLMTRDVESQVRAALARSIALSNDMPRDIALAVANDIAEVALPFIEVSAILTDDDLVAIINSKPAEYQVAVAARSSVSESVADALVDTGNETVVARLVANEGAQLSETTMNRVVDRFGTIKAVSNPLAQRTVVPISVAERLVTLVSEKIRDHLVTHHELPLDIATDLLLDSRERATLHLLDGSSDAPDVLELVDELHRNQRLTPTILMRAICLGDLTFFEAALAKRAGIPVAAAHALIHDQGDRGLERLFQRCGMPGPSLNVAREALAAIEDLDQSRDKPRDEVRELVLERVLTRFQDRLDEPNLDYLIAKIGSHPAKPSLPA